MTDARRPIGAGLAPARAARPIQPGERIHVVGAAGAGASAAALLASYSGARVSGCDPGGPSPYTPAVEAAGIPLAWSHDPSHVTTEPHPARLAATKALTAIAPDHPELAAARAAGIPVEPWQQVIADAAVGRMLVGVAGTHGKSTTAGWLVHLLVGAGRDPAAFVGALLPASLTGGLPATARRGDGREFVVEADEYAGNFDPYRPTVAVITNVDWDHPDVFADRTAVADAFEGWLAVAAATAPDGRITAVVNVGDPGAASLAERLHRSPIAIIATALVDPSSPWPPDPRWIAERFTTAVGPARPLLGRVTAADPGGTTLEIRGPDLPRGAAGVRLATAGHHNAADALTVAGAGLALGIPPAAAVEGLAGFSGVGRRLERKGERRGVVVYDDYGHHPTAIHETLAALRQREPGRRIWAVYEPLTYHRTAAFLEAFAVVLAEADAVAIADIWAGRDQDTTVTSAAALADEVTRRRPGLTVAAPGPVEATADWLAGQVHPGDAVLVMGGGRSYRIVERLLERLG